MKTRTVRLEEVCERIDYGFTASADFSVKEPRLLRITDIQNGSVDWNRVPGCRITPEEEADKRLSAGDIVFARTGATTGKCFLIEYAPRTVFASYLIRLRATHEILPHYLYAFFQSEQYWHQIKGAVRGAAQGGVNSTTLSSLVVPLPDLTDQRRIAQQLEQADKLRRTRRYALEHTDTFLPAAFLELFGDLRLNPRGYELRDFGDICDVRDGTHDSPRFHRHGIPLVTSKNLVSGAVDLSEVDLISEEDYEKINKRSKVDRGDILMPMIGTIGNPVLVEEPPRFAIKNVALIKPITDSPSMVYIRELLRGRYFEHLTSMNSRGGTQQFIALSDIRGFCIPVPSVPLQQKFATLVERVECLRTVQRETLRQAEHLFASLLHYAFGG